jgi:putative MATE family efflux protein
MGVAGAGLASSISVALGFLFFVFASFVPRYLRTYRYYSTHNLSFNFLKPIIKISLPVSFQNILILFGFLVFVSITGYGGIKEQAATQVVITALFISFMPCFGFGVAAQTLVGISLGNNNPKKAYKYGVETSKLAMIFTILVGLIFTLFPEIVLRIITPNNIVVSEAIPILRVAGVAQIVYGSGIVVASALQGAGDTLYVMYLEVITHWIVFLPLSYFLAITMGYGILGAWLAMPFYILAYTLFSWKRLRSDTWKKIKV